MGVWVGMEIGWWRWCSVCSGARIVCVCWRCCSAGFGSCGVAVLAPACGELKLLNVLLAKYPHNLAIAALLLTAAPRTTVERLVLCFFTLYCHIVTLSVLNCVCRENNVPRVQCLRRLQQPERGCNLHP